MEQKRGQLTKRIKEKSVELLGYKITQLELRLMPYVHYQLTNDQKLNNEHLNDDERMILKRWVDMGYILNGVTSNGRPMISETLKITKEFWDILNEIVFLGYVDLKYENNFKKSCILY